MRRGGMGEEQVKIGAKDWKNCGDGERKGEKNSE